MTSPAEALSASPSWVVAGGHAARAAALAAAWVLAWMLFLAGVAWPAARLHAVGRDALRAKVQVQLAVSHAAARSHP